MEKVKLIPPDLKQCQGEKPNGNTFLTLGGRPGLVRCTAKPVAVIKEVKPPKKGWERGSMSLCGECLAQACEQLGMKKFTVKRIREAE